MSLRCAAQTGGSTLFVSAAAVETMVGFRQTRSQDKEAGGQLFACFSGPDVVIVEATPPTILDYRSRCGFRPNRWLQRGAIMNRYRSGLHFVGDWHTHPEDQAKPSSEDICGMQDCFKRSAHDLTAFVMIIVGIAPPPAGWYVGAITGTSVQRLVCEVDGGVHPLAANPANRGN